MSSNTIYLRTTMEVGELQEIDKPNTPANHFSYELKMMLSENGARANVEEFTNKKYTNLHIQLVCEEKFQSDKVNIAMLRLKKYYNFTWGYVSEIDGTLVKSIPSANKVLNIDVFDIEIISGCVA